MSARWPLDVNALVQAVRTHKDVSDLCELAAASGARLATLDAGIKHPAAVVIA